MTPNCEATVLTTRPLRQSHSHTIKLFYLCQSVSICYYVLPSFLFSRNYVILYSNINITICCLFVVTVLVVQWLALRLHTQESQVQISWIQNSMFNCFICIFVFYTIFHFTFILLYSIQHYCTMLYYIILYFTMPYCTIAT